MVDARSDTDSNNSKLESAKKNNVNANDENEEDVAKIKSSSNCSSSEIANIKDDGHSHSHSHGGIDANSDIDIIYQETFTPWFVPLLFIAAPFFYKYGIIVYKNHDAGKDADDGGTQMEQKQEKRKITFGYGMKGPAITTGSAGGSKGVSVPSSLVPLSLSPSYWTSHTVPLEDIDLDSITVGTASALDNLRTFGGWGIRFGRVTKTKDTTSSSKHSYTFTRAYNACNGPYCEFTELIPIREGLSGNVSGSDTRNIDDQAAPLLKGKRYRIVSNEAEKVASLLRSGSKVVSPWWKGPN